VVLLVLVTTTLGLDYLESRVARVDVREVIVVDLSHLGVDSSDPLKTFEVPTDTNSWIENGKVKADDRHPLLVILILTLVICWDPNKVSKFERLFISIWN
jgi:hypothetical protein